MKHPASGAPKVLSLRATVFAAWIQRSPLHVRRFLFGATLKSELHDLDREPNSMWRQFGRKPSKRSPGASPSGVWRKPPTTAGTRRTKRAEAAGGRAAPPAMTPAPVGSFRSVGAVSLSPIAVPPSIAMAI